MQLGHGAHPDGLGLGPAGDPCRPTGHGVGCRTLGAVAAVAAWVHGIGQGLHIGHTLGVRWTGGQVVTQSVVHGRVHVVHVVHGWFWCAGAGHVRDMIWRRCQTRRAGHGRMRHATKSLARRGEPLQGDAQSHQAKDQNAKGFHGCDLNAPVQMIKSPALPLRPTKWPRPTPQKLPPRWCEPAAWGFCRPVGPRQTPPAHQRSACPGWCR